MDLRLGLPAVAVLGVALTCGAAYAPSSKIEGRATATRAFAERAAPGLIYVANTATDSITAYLSNSAGAVTSVLTLAGSRTELDGPVGMAFDAAGRLYVVNHGTSSSVTVYSAGASGNVAPLRTLAGPNTDLNDVAEFPDYPTGAIAVDLAHDRMFVARISLEQSPFCCDVLIYSAGATGDEAPIGSIGLEDGYNEVGSGPSVTTAPNFGFYGREILVGTNFNACCHGDTGWSYYTSANLSYTGSFSYYGSGGLAGFAVSPISGNIVAAQGGDIDIWPAGETGTGDWPFTCPQGCLLPLASFGSGIAAVAVDPTDTIWALDSSTNALESFAPGSTTPRFATRVFGASAVTVEAHGPTILSPPCTRPGRCHQPFAH
jgi:hypothetical protein